MISSSPPQNFTPSTNSMDKFETQGDEDVLYHLKQEQMESTTATSSSARKGKRKRTSNTKPTQKPQPPPQQKESACRSSESEDESPKPKKKKLKKKKEAKKTKAAQKENASASESVAENPVRKSARRGNDGKEIDNQEALICPHADSHRERTMEGLEEEDNVLQLKGGYLKDAKCSVCNKGLVHAKKSISEGESNKTLFNCTNALFVCINFKSKRKEPCKFCMCHACYVDISTKADEEAANLSTRRSSSRKR